MKQLKRTSILKAAIIFFALSIAVTGVLYFVFNYQFIDDKAKQKREELVNMRKQELKDIVSLTVQHINNESQRLKNAELLTVEDIKEKILYQMTKLHYGNYGYIFICDYNNVVISHPDKNLINKDFSNIRDVNGNLIVPPLVSVATTSGEGYCSYFWNKPQDNIAYEKITFAKNFPQWKWVVASGVYVDEIDKEVAIYKSNLKSNLLNSVLIIAIIVILLFIAAIFFAIRNIFTPTKKAAKILDEMSVGVINNEINYNKTDEIGQIYISLKKLVQNLKNVTHVATEIGKGNLKVDYKPAGEKDELGNALIDMRNSLSNAQEIETKRKAEETERNWATQGFANFGDILRQNSDDINVLSDKIITELVHYLNANQGGLFILNDENKEHTTLDLLSAYAFERKKFMEKSINIGEGLVGTCAIEKQSIYITDVPDDYINITSGLGNSNPRSILIVPLKIEQDVYGVVEIASFNEFAKYQIEFVEKIGESIASTLSTVKINQKTATLLEQSQQQAEELAAQEEEMRQNLEEMQATQEEAARREAEMASLLEALNSSALISEFDLQGNILNINDNFVKLFGASSKEDFIGQNHKNFYEMAKNFGEYSEFWNRIKSGEIVLSQRSQINMPNGKIIWLNEAYSPIKDSEGNIIKIFNISTDITNQVINEKEIAQQNEQLASQEEETKQNLEEMMAIQEETNIVQKELLSYNQIIDNLSYKLELDSNNILISEDLEFFKTLGYDFSKISNLDFQSLISKTDKEKYNNIISDLTNGIAQTETLKILNSKSEEKDIEMSFTAIMNDEDAIDKIWVFIKK